MFVLFSDWLMLSAGSWVSNDSTTTKILYLLYISPQQNNILCKIMFYITQHKAAAEVGTTLQQIQNKKTIEHTQWQRKLPLSLLLLPNDSLM